MKNTTLVNKTDLNITNFFHKYGFIFIVIVYTLLFISSVQYGSFTDEKEQFTAGWFISQGLIPYQDFFSHHGPLPLFFGTIPFVLLGHSVQNFILLRILVFIFQLCCWSVLWKFSDKKYRPLVTSLILLTGVALPVFNLHMTLATSLTTPTLLVVALLTLQHIQTQKPNIRTIIVVFGAGAFICLWSSIATLIPLLFLGILLALFWTKQKLWLKVIKFRKPIIITTLLQLIFPLFFLLTKSFTDFWWSIFTYNSSYYFPLHLAEDNLEKQYGPLFRQMKQFFTELYEAITITLRAFITLLQSLVGMRHLLLQGEVLTSMSKYLTVVFTEFLHSFIEIRLLMMIGLLLVTVMLSLKKKLHGFIFFVLVFSFWFRDNELFHLSSVFLITVSGLLYVFFQYQKKLPKLLIISFLFIFFIPVLELRSKFFQHKESPISLETIHQAEIIHNATQPNDQILLLNNQIIGYALAERLPASKYYFYFPWVYAVPKIEDQANTTIITQQPTLISVSDEFKSEFPSLFKTVEDNYQFDEQTSLFIKR